jgi:glycosyltransferase involved in cell wall biosynthesis
MTLDIMVPFWGDPALLHATIDTVRTQTDPDWQLTVVDDCYPDPEVAASFARETDPRIRYLRNEHNLGITANYERCRDLAEHDLMVFLGCDDLLLPTYVETVRAAHERFPAAAIIQPGVQVVDGDGTVVSPLGDRVKAFLRPGATTATVLSGEALATSLLRGNWMYWPSLAFRTDVLRRHDFREGLPIVQDLALVVDMVAAGESMVVDPTVCFAYRRHEASASSTTLVSGSRLGDDRRYYRSAAEQMADRGWKRAARAARLRATSRLHAVSLMPGAARARDAASFRALVRHAAGA